MINPMGKNHPIHIHLIQYQTVELIALKKREYRYVNSEGKTEKVECSYYWMDFLKVQAFSDMSKGISNSELTRIVNFTKNFTDKAALCYFI